MKNNNNQNYIKASEAIYLGYIEDPDSFERCAVIKIPQADKPIVVFCPDLTLMDIGEVAYSKDNPEQVGEHMSTLELINSSSIAPQLEVGNVVTVYFRTGWFPVMRIEDDSAKVKGIFCGEPSNRFDDGFQLQPPSLKKVDHIPRGRITMSGEIVGESGHDFIIDASVPVLIPNNLEDERGEKLKIGDCVEGRIGQIYFLEKEG